LAGIIPLLPSALCALYQFGSYVTIQYKNNGNTPVTELHAKSQKCRTKVGFKSTVGTTVMDRDKDISKRQGRELFFEKPIHKSLFYNTEYQN